MGFFGQFILVWFPIGLIVYHWIGFPILLLFLARIVRFRKQRELRPVPTSVTVVIAAHNEEAVIRQKLDNTLALVDETNEVEILVGSDGSDDATDEIVSSYSDPRVRLIRLSHRSGKPAVLNRLMAEARGEVLLFTDADVLIKPGSLQSMLQYFRDPKVAVVQPHYERINPDGSPGEGAFDRYESWLKKLEGAVGAVVGAYGWALAVRRDSCSPIPEDTILDDFLLAVRPFRGGFDVVYDVGARCWTKAEAEHIEFWRKARIARGSLQALLRNIDLFLPRYGIKAWVLISHKLLRWATPLFMLLILVGCILFVCDRLYAALLAVQLAVYATTPLAYRNTGILRKVLVPQYYVLQNVALLVGYWQFFTNKEKYWARTPRTPGQLG